MATNPSSTTHPTRRPYHGSCHCGKTRYIVYLTLPPTLSAYPPESIAIYKCNCSTCLKMSYFHTRPIDSPNDFQLLSPLNPTTGGLNDYTCFDKDIHWYFCGVCGVRCFAVAGEGEVKEVETEEGKKQVWKVKSEGWDEKKSNYLSVNAATIEPGQEGFSLKEWTEKGWIAYGEMREGIDVDRYGEPYEGGMY
jgi:hypothetical protein